MRSNWRQHEVVARVEEFFGRVGQHLKDRRKRESFAIYAYGILGDGERKSAEPIAARACGDPEKARAMHEKLLHFLRGARWDDRAVRYEGARYAIEALQAREPVTTWIIDDTGFLKQGTHSPGVQRQYTGSAGKIANCQIGVSLAVATSTDHVPLDFALYLPQGWVDDPARRAEAHIPVALGFKSKVELALDMMLEADIAGIPGDIVLADSAYGDCSDFRNAVRGMGFDFGVGVKATTKVVRVDKLDRTCGEPLSVSKLVEQLGPKAFRRVAWRHGTKDILAGRFCFFRVKTLHEDGIDLAAREALWLVAEQQPSADDTSPKFVLTTLPRRMGRRQIVRLFKERWRTERMYEDLKGELGLDHFEGRTFAGWHHHVSVVLCCYAFVVAERARAFPPSAAGTREHGAQSRAA